jgi:hypothetical protein
MTDKDLSEILEGKRAAVVHLSHHGVMDPLRPIFPEDMRRALAMREEINLSCVVIWPGHRMSLPGSVGVIFKPKCANVNSVSNSDAGSMTLADGTDGSLGSPLTQETLTATFDVQPGHYNEWRVRGAEVLGIFVDDPRSISVKKDLVFYVGGEKVITVAADPIGIAEVFSAFPKCSIFVSDHLTTPFPAMFELEMLVSM